MATSGTIGVTKFTVIRIIEKALRRCGLNPSATTAETLEMAREDLFILMMSLSSRGLNLWCIDTVTVALVAGQASYVLPIGTIDVLNMVLSSPTSSPGDYSDIPVMPMNRDDYANQPRKSFQSATPVNYYFEKLVDPKITLWPVPSDAAKHLTIYRYRQIQDIGEFVDELELPARWGEAIIWQLALRLTFEMPEVSKERMAAVQQMAATMVIEAEGNETDNAPTYIAPNIRGYTR